MFQIAKEDVLRGLKKFKRLAKQDLLASSLTTDPEFWSRQAEARREKYDLLMRMVDQDGVETAYETALRQYVELPRLSSSYAKNPRWKGFEQALEMFFVLLGVSPEAIKKAEKVKQSIKREPVAN